MEEKYFLFMIISIFIIIGVMLPYAQQVTNSDYESYNIEGIHDELKNSGNNAINIIDVLFSVLKMFVFTFGALPLWLDLVLFMPLRIIAYIMIYDLLPFT